MPFSYRRTQDPCPFLTKCADELGLTCCRHLKTTSPPSCRACLSATSSSWPRSCAWPSCAPAASSTTRSSTTCCAAPRCAWGCAQCIRHGHSMGLLSCHACAEAASAAAELCAPNSFFNPFSHTGHGRGQPPVRVAVRLLLGQRAGAALLLATPHLIPPARQSCFVSAALLAKHT